ncbi:hypothetical protein CHI08_26440, partial [Peribacillus simplex]
ILFSDTSYIKIKPFTVLRDIIKNYNKSSHVIIMPDIRAFQVLLPLYICWNMISKKDLRYVVIGGWLPDFLLKSRFYRNLCSKIDGIYVEANEM